MHLTYSHAHLHQVDCLVMSFYSQIRQLRHLNDGSVNVVTKGRQRFRICKAWTEADGAVCPDCVFLSVILCYCVFSWFFWYTSIIIVVLVVVVLQFNSSSSVEPFGSSNRPTLGVLQLFAQVQIIEEETPLHIPRDAFSRLATVPTFQSGKVPRAAATSPLPYELSDDEAALQAGSDLDAFDDSESDSGPEDERS